MKDYEQLQKSLTKKLFYLFALLTIIIIGGWWLLDEQLNMSTSATLIILVVSGLSLAFALSLWATVISTEPLSVLLQAMKHVSKDQSTTGPPNLETIRTGRKLVSELVMQIYELASQSHQPKKTDTSAINETILKSFPLPLLVLDNQQKILFANEEASKYVGSSSNSITGEAVYDSYDMSFQNEMTFERWLNDCRANKVTDKASWDRVKLNRKDNLETRQFDLAAYFVKDSPTGVETVLVLFDHSAKYGQDEEAVGFIALAVHELRTPLTIMRGYLEVFEDELGDTLSPEMKEFMHKMNASAQQLTAFVSNILNVARVEDNQLVLNLHEENWESVVRSSCKDLELRARVRGIHIEYNIEPNLPSVGVDKVSIFEVLNNLIDNAIKYSGKSDKIVVSARKTTDGLVETTVQDFGVGIPESVIPNLFAKFYRSHRSRASIGGTGLGLYLCKAIISAHGGNVWVKSKENEGSSFSFTLLPYSQIAEENKQNPGSDGIVRGAHGWIKNHSLYRR